MDSIGLVVICGDAVIADVRIGERDDLTGIRRVGYDLLIPREHGVENHLAARNAIVGFRTECVPLEY